MLSCGRPRRRAERRAGPWCSHLHLCNIFLLVAVLLGSSTRNLNVRLRTRTASVRRLNSPPVCSRGFARRYPLPGEHGDVDYCRLHGEWSDFCSHHADRPSLGGNLSPHIRAKSRLPGQGRTCDIPPAYPRHASFAPGSLGIKARRDVEQQARECCPMLRAPGPIANQPPCLSFCVDSFPTGQSTRAAHSEPAPLREWCCPRLPAVTRR